MSAITINGLRVATGSITIPYYGAWSADIELPDNATLPSAATLIVGDLTLKGTVVRTASFAGGCKARIVGGAAGWRKELPARGYSHVVGVRVSILLADAASESGESIVVDSDRSVGTSWARDRSKGESLLRLLVGGAWWVDANGITQTKSRDGSAIANPFTVNNYSGARGSFEISTESIASWQPGRTFKTFTVTETQTVSSVTIEADNEGKIRLHVLNTEGAKERLRNDLRSIIRAETPNLSFAGVWEYTIAANTLALGLVSTIDCTPTDSRMPPLTNVPLVGMGVVAPPATGTKCRIQFANNDPSRAECVSLDGVSEHVMTTEATALLIYNVLVALMSTAGGGPLLAAVLQPLIVPAMLTAMAAQCAPAPPGVIAQTILNATLAASMVAGTTPSNAVGALAEGLSLLSSKTPDVSGFFPSVGVPNG